MYQKGTPRSGPRRGPRSAPRRALKLSIDPINSHASYIGRSTGPNKRSVPNNHKYQKDV